MIPEFNGDFIQWLRGFYYTATLGGMSAASDKMNRNQSAITHQIHCLEEEFGVKLFSGTKTNRVLTSEGRYLLLKATQLFNGIDEMRLQISSLPTDIAGEINISAMYTAFNHYLPTVIGKFSIKYPGVKFNISGQIFQGDLYKKVQSNEVDMAVISADDISEEFHKDLLFKTNLILLVPAEYKLISQSAVSLEEIAAMPLIAPPLSSTLWQFLTRQFSRYGLSLSHKHMVEHQEAVKEYISQGIGVSIMDELACTGSVMKNIKAYSLVNYFPPRQYYLIRKREMPFIYPHIKAFTHFIANFDKSSITGIY